MRLFEIFKEHFDLLVNPIEEFRIIDVLKYFSEEDLPYKHTMGVASQMQAIIKQLELKEEEKDLMQIAYMLNIGQSRRVKHRMHHALDAAIFTLEKGLGQTLALALMFNTAAYGQARLTKGELKDIYEKARPLFLKDEKAIRYSEYLTYCNLNTELDGRPTNYSRRVFKILAREKKGTPTYKNIKTHKRYFKRLDKKIRIGVLKEVERFKTLKRFLDILRAKN